MIISFKKIFHEDNGSEHLKVVPNVRKFKPDEIKSEDYIIL